VLHRNPEGLSSSGMKQSLGAVTLIYPTPVFLVGTYDKAGKPNIMTASWGGICCSSPPCVAVSLRKATYTFGNIVERKAFTISIPSENQAKAADRCGLSSGRTTDKFAATGLTAVRSDLVDAPYVKECPLIVECKLVHTFELGLHTQFVGEVLDVKADKEVMKGKGLVDILKVKPLIFTPDTQEYYGVGQLIGGAFSIGEKI
jgi:flavin reductase (DIM6/NTAB) family NADH-FMN oxidoreductase RutF